MTEVLVHVFSRKWIVTAMLLAEPMICWLESAGNFKTVDEVAKRDKRRRVCRQK